VAEEVTGQPAAEPSFEEMAASVAKGILQAEEGPVTPRDETGKFTKAQPETEAKEEQPEETQEEATETEAEEQPQPEKRTYKVRVKSEDGSDLEEEVDEDTLISGYMKDRDYRAKTAQLAREREAAQAKIKEAVEPKLREYETQLETYKQAVLKLADPEAMSADLNKLAETDPARAQLLFFKRLEINQTLQAVAQEQHKIATQRQQEMQESMQKQAREAIDALQRDIPGWSNELYGKVLKTGKDQYGFKAEEVNAITDPRAIKVLHDAMKYQELKAAKPQVGKKVVTVPKVVKPGTTSEKSDPVAEKWNEGMAKLKKSGRTEDAVAVAKLMLARESRQQK
jgi:hypothetical protein